MSHIFHVCEKNGEILVISGREKLYVGVWSLLWSLMWPTVKNNLFHSSSLSQPYFFFVVPTIHAFTYFSWRQIEPGPIISNKRSRKKTKTIMVVVLWTLDILDKRFVRSFQQKKVIYCPGDEDFFERKTHLLFYYIHPYIHNTRIYMHLILHTNKKPKQSHSGQLFLVSCKCTVVITHLSSFFNKKCRHTLDTFPLQATITTNSAAKRGFLKMPRNGPQ